MSKATNITRTIHGIHYELRHDDDGYSWHWCNSKGDPRLCGFPSPERAVEALELHLGANCPRPCPPPVIGRRRGRRAWQRVAA